MKTLKPTPYPRGYEKQFEKMLGSMVDAMVQQYENQTFKKLNQRTIKKFEDAQIGNWASVFTKLDKAAQRKLKKRFNNKRLRRLVRKHLTALNKQNQRNFYERAEDEIGIPMQQLIAREGLTPEINALMLETEQWIQKLRDDTLEEFAANSLRIMAKGVDYETALNEYRDEGNKRKNHAQFIARNQISTFNGLSNKLRYQKLGITQAVWVTARDERVRECHKVRDGKVYDLDKGLYSSCDGKTLFPGLDYNCRCIAKPIIPAEEGDENG